VKGTTVVLLVLLLEKNSVSNEDFTFFSILLLLLSTSYNDPFPSTGAMNIEANNNTNCSEIRVIVIVLILNFVLNSIPYKQVE
jgi:hypothetical protein